MGDTDKVANATPDQANVGSGFDVSGLSEEAKEIIGKKVKEGADAKTIIETLSKDYKGLESKLGERKVAQDEEIMQRIMAGDPKDQLAKQIKEKYMQPVTTEKVEDTEELTDEDLADAEALVNEIVQKQIKGLDVSKDKAEMQAIRDEIRLERRQQQEEVFIKKLGGAYDELVARLGTDWLRPFIDINDVKNSDAIKLLFNEDYKGLRDFRNPLEAAIRLIASPAALRELNEAPSYTEGPGFSAPPRKASAQKKAVNEVLDRIEKAAPPTSKTLGIT